MNKVTVLCLEAPPNSFWRPNDLISGGTTVSMLTRARRWIGTEVQFSRRRKGGRRMVERGVTTGRVKTVHEVTSRGGGVEFILYEIEFGPQWDRRRSHFRREDFFRPSGNGSVPESDAAGHEPDEDQPQE